MHAATRFDLSGPEREGLEMAQRIAEAHRPAGDGPLSREALQTVFAELAPTGYLASVLPAEMGGRGLTPLAFGALVEGLSPALTLLGNHSVQRYLAEFGTAAQQDRFLPPLLDGSCIGAIAITESQAGSDLSALATRAERQGRHWRLNGRKTWVTHGMVATEYIVLARTGEESRSFTRFIVPASTPGLSARPLHPLGLKHLSFAELVFEDCKLPDEFRLGEEGKGAEGAKTAFPLARALAALHSLRIAQAALDCARDYARARVIVDAPLSERGLVQDAHVRLWTGIESARLLAYRVLADMSRPDAARCASAVKAAAADLAIEACRWAGEVLGSQGLDANHRVNALWNDARMMGVVDGTSVLNRLVVARRTVAASSPAVQARPQ